MFFEYIRKKRITISRTKLLEDEKKEILKRFSLKQFFR